MLQAAAHHAALPAQLGARSGGHAEGLGGPGLRGLAQLDAVLNEAAHELGLRRTVR